MVPGSRRGRSLVEMDHCYTKRVVTLDVGFQLRIEVDLLHHRQTLFTLNTLFFPIASDSSTQERYALS